jgi:hypothetical protein
MEVKEANAEIDKIQIIDDLLAESGIIREEEKAQLLSLYKKEKVISFTCIPKQTEDRMQY